MLTDIPRAGAAIYTIWDDAGELIYVGVSGRSATVVPLTPRASEH
jgi:hypothetical protein